MSDVKFKLSAKYSVRGKLLSAILVTSSLVTLVLTCIQLANDYRSDLSYIQKRMNEIRLGRSATFAHALWQLDTALIETGLEGLLSVQDVIYAEISDQPDKKIEVGTGTFKRGKFDADQALSYSEPLYHIVEPTEETATLKAGQKIHLGDLNVVFTKNLIYERLQNKAILIMATQAIKTFVVSLLILIFIRVLVTQHLSTMASYFHNFDIGNLNAPLKLKKKPHKGDPNIDRRDELDLVAEAINKMIEKVKESYELQRLHKEKLHEMNLSLDRRVKEQTSQLADEKQQMTMLLDNMSQAVFRVGPDRKIVPPISKHTADILGKDVEGKEVFDLIFNNSQIDPETRDMIKGVFTVCYGEDSLQWEMNEHNLPDKLKMANSDQILRMLYSPLYGDADQLNQILFVIEDITQMQKLEEQRIKSSRQIAIMQAFASAGKQDIISFFDSCERQVKVVENQIGISASAEALVNCYRELHTLKGNARMLHFDEIGKATHNLESEVSSALETLRAGKELPKENIESISAKFIELKELLATAANIGVRFFALSLPFAESPVTQATRSRSMEILRSSYYNLKSALAGLKGRVKAPEFIEVNEAFEELTFVSLESGIEKLKPMVDEIANRVGKSVQLHLDGPDLLVPPQSLEKLIEVAMHMVRNAVDHGIETLENRLAAKKDSTGRISISWSVARNDGIRLVISDDGRGIDVAKVRSKAIQMGLIGPKDSQTEEEIIQLIFAPTLSTAELVSDLSGRGVGMDVVSNVIKDLQGSIKVHSTLGVGTQFEVHLKLHTKINQADSNAQSAA